MAKQHKTINTNVFRQAFTLVELSIVLVIIGLVLGGVLVGSDLIRQAEIRNVLSEKQIYAAAMTQFVDKFRLPPGDFDQATELWGKLAICGGTSATKYATCDGTGNGFLDSAVLGYFGFGSSANDEWFYAWQHLSNAGFTKDQRYSGGPGPIGPYDTVVGWNIPKSSGFNGAGWGLVGNIAWLGADDAPGTNGLNAAPIISASEAYAIDYKIDDGKPTTGLINGLLGVEASYPDIEDTPFTGCAYLSDGTSAHLFNKDAEYGVGDFEFDGKKDEVTCILRFGNMYAQ